jgi:hypothetical protein
LLEQVAIALGYEFKPYVPDLCPYLLRVLQHDKSKDKIVTTHVSADNRVQMRLRCPMF